MNSKLLRNTLLVFLLAVSGVVHAKEEFYKEIKKVINVSQTATLDMDLSFANVNVTTGDFNQMEIIVKMDLNVRSEEKANRIFNGVRIEESTDYVKLIIKENGGEMNCRGNEYININVEVKMPLTCRLAGNVGFGNVNVSGLGGEMHLNVDYGNLSAGNLTASTNKITVDFGNLETQQFNGGLVKVSYGNVDIALMNGNSTIESDFGNVDVRRVTARVQQVTIEVSYGNAEVVLDKDCSFNIDADSEFGEIELPRSVKTTTSKSDYTSKEVKAAVGSGSGQFQAHVEFGNLTVLMK